MCISAAPATFSNTTVAAWGKRHPKHGDIHVVAYSNAATNLSGGPNAMLLLLPVAEPMTQDNAIDTSADPTFLKRMADAIRPRTRSLGTKSSRTTPKALVFDMGSYTVVMSRDAHAVRTSLHRVREDRRPSISKDLFNYMAQQRPNDSVVLCCFNDSVSSKEPVMFWYKPRDLRVLAAPALDAHTGGAPDFSKHVTVDHTVIFGTDVDFPNAVAMAWDETPGTMESFLPHYIAGGTFTGQRPNGDFLISDEAMFSGRIPSAIMRGLTSAG